MLPIVKSLKKSQWLYSLIKPIKWSLLLKLVFQKRQKKSIIFFTQHKSASTFVAKILEIIGSENVGLKHVNYPNLVSDVGCYFDFGERFQSENDWFYQNSNSMFEKIGHIYGPHRMPFFIPEIALFKKIIFLRDPRDSLISRYYSFGFSHGVPRDSVGGSIFLEERKKIVSESIDKYCERMAHEWSKPLLSSYIKMINLSIESPLIIKYEDYVENPLKIIRKIFEYSEIDECEHIVQSLSSEAKPVRQKVNLKSHRRSGKVLQYTTELDTSTVSKISEILKEEIQFFGWEK